VVEQQLVEAGDSRGEQRLLEHGADVGCRLLAGLHLQANVAGLLAGNLRSGVFEVEITRQGRRGRHANGIVWLGTLHRPCFLSSQVNHVSGHPLHSASEGLKVQNWVGLVRFFQPADFVGRKLHIERRDGSGEVVGLAGTHDGGCNDGLGQCVGTTSRNKADKCSVLLTGTSPAICAAAVAG
jgi:hypothetical protein